MNWDTIQGKWREMKGDVIKAWGKLTDDDVTEIKGERERLAGKLQERYGLAKDEAERQIKDFESRCNC